MSADFFLDTNVLIYAADTSPSEVRKAAIALSLITKSEAVISTQVLGEFYRASTNPKRQRPLTHPEATLWIDLWLKLRVVPITTTEVTLASQVLSRYGIGYYDALILAAASQASCSTV